MLKRCENVCNTRFYFLDENGKELLLIECWTGDSGRVGFQHRGVVFLNSDWLHVYKHKFYKVQYYNRTWEKYRYQSLVKHVLRNLLKDKTITQEEYNKYLKEVETL